MRIALIGNPNSGKTTLFNLLTGRKEKTGNWSGVTTVKAAGRYVKNKSVEIIDLPGVYSFSAQSKDEKEVVNFLSASAPDAIINVVDSTNLERNLYLTCLLIKTGIPIVIALNFSDEAEKKGVFADERVLSRAFGAEFIKISAKKRINVFSLVPKAALAEKNPARVGLAVGESPTEIYEYISANIPRAVKVKEKVKKTKADKIDGFITGKFTGIPVFIVIIFLVYLASLKAGGYFSGYIERFFTASGNNISAYLSEKNAPDAITSFISVAIIKSVGTVFAFLPQILALFILLTVLEESGYMARASFLLDRIFKNVGLGGKSVIPFVLSCGCAVNGIMATRVISEEKERRNAVFLCPFMPCGAKTAVFGWFSYKFFGGSAIVSTAMYFIGLSAAVICGAILNKREKGGGFLLEIPPLRLPTLNAIFITVTEKIKEFIVKSGTVIISVSVFFWFFSHFNLKGYTLNAEESFLFYAGNAIKYLFYPLGFSDWKASVALLSGLFAKEAVVETAELLSLNYATVFSSKFTLFSYMTFILLSPPCAAAVQAAKRELKNGKEFLLMIAVQVSAAFAFSCAINLAGIILRKNLIFPISLFIILALSAIMAVSCFKSRDRVKKGNPKCKKKRKRSTTL